MLNTWSLVDAASFGSGRYLLLREGPSPAAAAARGDTQRLLRILSRAATAASSKLIALELNLSNTTVSKHLARGLAALGLESRTELVRLMRGDSLATVPPGFRVRLEGEEGARRAVVAFPVGFELVDTPLPEGPRAVLQGLFEGKSNKAIAAHRKTSAMTVANQIAYLGAYLGVSSRYEIVRAATPWTRILPLPPALPAEIEERFTQACPDLALPRSPARSVETH